MSETRGQPDHPTGASNGDRARLRPGLLEIHRHQRVERDLAALFSQACQRDFGKQVTRLPRDFAPIITRSSGHILRVVPGARLQPDFKSFARAGRVLPKLAWMRGACPHNETTLSETVLIIIVASALPAPLAQRPMRQLVFQNAVTRLKDLRLQGNRLTVAAGLPPLLKAVDVTVLAGNEDVFFDEQRK
jgi:hypothetical protein